MTAPTQVTNNTDQPNFGTTSSRSSTTAHTTNTNNTAVPPGRLPEGNITAASPRSTSALTTTPSPDQLQQLSSIQLALATAAIAPTPCPNDATTNTFVPHAPTPPSGDTTTTVSEYWLHPRQRSTNAFLPPPPPPTTSAATFTATPSPSEPRPRTPFRSRPNHPAESLVVGPSPTLRSVTTTGSSLSAIHAQPMDRPSATVHTTTTAQQSATARIAIHVPTHVDTTQTLAFDAVIATAGATHQSRTAAAITIRRTSAARVTEEVHSRIFCGGSTTTADLCATIAAINASATGSHTAILIPKIAVFELLTGQREPTTTSGCQQLVANARSLLAAAPHLSLHRVSRSDIGATFALARSTITRGTGAGDAALFPVFAPATMAPEQPRPLAPITAPPTSTISGFESFEEFCALPRPRSRTLSRAEWPRLASISHEYLSRALVPDEGVASASLRQFLAIPSRIMQCHKAPTIAATTTGCGTTNSVPAHSAPIQTATTSATLPLPTSSSNDLPRPAIAPDKSQVRRCISLARDGLLSRAVSSLTPSPVLNLALPGALDCAQSKFPALKEVIPPTISTAPTISAELVREALHKMANGAASGFTGWTKEILRAACDADPIIASLLAEVFSRILRGGYDALTMRCLCATRFIGLQKHNRPANEDMRPICIGDVLHRLLAACCAAASPIPLPPWQLGCGAPNGVEKAAHKVRDA